MDILNLVHMRKMNDIYKIVELLKKDQAGNILDQESELLSEILNDKAIFDIYNQISDDEYLQSKFLEYRKYSHKTAFNKFTNQIVKKRSRKLFISIAQVAASLIIIFSVAYIFLSDKKIEEVKVAENIINPGKNLAELLLADGKKIKLDNKVFNIKEKDGALIKSDSGKVSYTSISEGKEILYNKLVVPRGGEFYLELADGSKVWLNSDTEIKYPVSFSGKKREVFLRGEAYFQVSRNIEQPFIVHTLLGNVNVLGTGFCVRAYKKDNKVLTTLVEGKVRFDSKKQKKVAVELLPGQQAVAMKSGSVKVKKVNVEEYVGWKDGLHIFKDTRLEDIMNNLERWYNVNVFYRNTSLKELEFTGNLRRYDNINTFLELLEITEDVKFIIKGNAVTVIKP